MDKDQKEIDAVKEEYPNAHVIICHFHCLQAVDRRLVIAKLESVDLREQVMATFKSALYTTNEVEFLAACVELTNLGKKNTTRIKYKNRYNNTF